jgi:hypothetical protein
VTRAAVLLALLAAGCADPYTDAPPPRTVAGELPAPPVHQPDAPTTPARTPEAAARRAAELTTTWTGETAAANYRRLARLTTGEARRDAEATAARLPTDPQLDATQSEGSVKAIARTTRSDLIVVTRETLTGDGLRQTRWRVTLARAERHGDGWLLSRWEPQP